MNQVKSELTLTDRQLCDCEMIMDNSFSPLDGFMNKGDYSSVLEKMRLEDGSLFPIPVVLDVNKEFSNQILVGEKVLLRDKEGFKVAFLSVESIWEPDFNKEAQLVYGTKDLSHPGIDFLYKKSFKIYLGGKIEKIASPNHYDFKKYRLTPDQAKNIFKEKGWDKIIAFQTRNPLHRAHVQMTLNSMEDIKANLFLHPVVGLTKSGDIDHFTRVRCYEHVLRRYKNGSVVLGLLPLAMRMAGPREALLHAIIRKNYGCSHIIIGRDHAGPGNNIKGDPFYGPYDAQKLVKRYEVELGIKMMPFQSMVYVPQKDKYLEISTLEKNTKHKTISGTEMRVLLEKGKSIPDWFTYKEISLELKKSVRPLEERGFTVFFTGLSGSGKSSIANGLLTRLLENGARPVTLLDGDLVRKHLSSELGFSKKHRSLNVQRIGFVASEITKCGGIAICAPIAPYKYDRQINRELISQYGGYVEVSVSTPLKKCEERDSKGLYKLAREGKIKKFTGISDPYETPNNPEFILNSDGSVAIEKLVDDLFEGLIKLGYIKHKKF